MEIISEAAAAPRPAGTLMIVFGLFKTFARVVLGYLAFSALIAVIYFPYHTDAVVPSSVIRAADKFYAEIYQQPTGGAAPAGDSDYVQNADYAIEQQGVIPRLRKFVEDYDLKDRHVLDVGAGTGYLQDLSSGYVGLDISPTASRFFHKPFIQASATSLPIPDDAFDAVWSIWVLEHVPNPEQALLEMRRVVKNGGLLYLEPAWNCTSWAADGYEVRPYSDFGFGGKLIKASLLLRATGFYRGATILPVRLVRAAAAQISGQPTRYHYDLLKPNFNHYWVSDSDAVNSLDYYETLLWFTSRGDECLNCGPNPILATQPLIVRVHKN